MRLRRRDRRAERHLASLTEAARIVGVHPATLSLMLRGIRVLPRDFPEPVSRPPGARYRWRRTELEAWAVGARAR